MMREVIILCYDQFVLILIASLVLIFTLYNNYYYHCYYYCYYFHWMTESNYYYTIWIISLIILYCLIIVRPHGCIFLLSRIKYPCFHANEKSICLSNTGGPMAKSRYRGMLLLLLFDIITFYPSYYYLLLLLLFQFFVPQYLREYKNIIIIPLL